jgi:hypothetical protein
MKLRKQNQLKKERKNNSIRLKINYEAQFSIDSMFNDNETSITS